MQPEVCPHEDQVSSLLQGRLDVAAARELECHIETCQHCLATVRSLSNVEESFLQRLREVSAGDVLMQQSDTSARERLQALAEGIVETMVSLKPAPPATSPTPELKMIREYQLQEKLGEGGMGAVYKALHTRLDKTVALKVLPHDRTRDEAAVARFQREMKAVGKLEHPNIVRAMDAGEADGMHFLVMEYVQGLDLSQLARSIGKLPIAEACELIRQACVGLQEAHEHGMVHRDIKPSNLILAQPRRKQDQPTVKVLDLGLALLDRSLPHDDNGLTGTGQMMGTVDYMAPEQCRSSHDVDIRADIYALGATLYKLLSGDSPLGGRGDQSILGKLMLLATEPPPPLKDRRPDMPPRLVAIVERMLAKQPEQRFSTPEDVAEALSPFCTGADLRTLLNQAAATAKQPIGERETFANRMSAASDTAPTAARVQAVAGQGTRGPWWHNRKLIAAAAVPLAAILLLAIWFIVKDKFGNEVARVKVPEGGTGQVVHAKDDPEPLRETPTPGAKPFSLYFGEQKGVMLPATLAPDTSQPFTLETYVTLQRDVAKSVGLVFNNSRAQLEIWQTNQLAGMLYFADGKRLILNASQPLKMGKRTHVALVRTADQVLLFQDGQIVDRKDIKNESGNAKKNLFYLGNGDKDWFVGTLEEIRVSSVARYTKEFVPQPRLETDDNTLALFHCDEGETNDLPDSSGNGYHGRLMEAKWVRAGGQSLPSSVSPTTKSGEPPLAVAPFNAQQAKQHQQAWADHLGVPVQFTDKLGLEFQLIPAGSFEMGSTEKEVAAINQETAEFWVKNGFTSSQSPRRRVTITKPFYLATREVTAGPFLKYIKATGDTWERLDRISERPEDLEPADVTWASANRFLKWISAEEEAKHRLPTEAEWEFACRAGTITNYWNGDGPPAGRKSAAGRNSFVNIDQAENPFGLFGVMGGHWDWCQDYGFSQSYQMLPARDPLFTKEKDGNYRVLRGGSIAKESISEVPSAWRYWLGPEHWLSRNGVRPVREIPMPSASLAISPLPKVQNFELDLSGQNENSFAHVLLPQRRQDESFTLEMWASPRSAKTINSRALFVFGRLGLKQAGDGWQWYADYDNVRQTGIQAERRVHLACTVADKSLTMYVDGRLAGQSPITKELKPTPMKMMLGRDDNTAAWASFDGTIDEVRISDGIRYASDFKPEQRLSVDDQTWALYHCDEGTGEVLFDASANKRHGKLVGVTWSRVDGVKRPAPAAAPFAAEQAEQHQQAWADYLGVPVQHTDDFGVEFKLIPPGEFLMGSSQEEIDQRLAAKVAESMPEWLRANIKAEGPQHRVRITKPFYLSTHEITTGQFEKFVQRTGHKTDAERDGKGGMAFKEGKLVHDPALSWRAPSGVAVAKYMSVRQISWNDAVAFCTLLNLELGQSYRLPSEAEWEFACRAGTETAFAIGDELTTAQAAVENPLAMPVKSFPANPFGLYDLHGNAAEWCRDSITESYEAGQAVDPVVDQGTTRVLRGGAFNLPASSARSAARRGGEPTFRTDVTGFRVVTTIEAVRQSIAKASSATESEATTISPAPSKVIPPPIKINEPPPLEEWLKGRKLRTVAQNGSGEFKTIQAALDALKKGEVVQVLDKGPYRESLQLTDPPADIGLVSEQRTAVEIAEWKEFKNENSKFEYRHGHQIINARGFRLCGFEMVGTPGPETNPHVGLHFEAASDATVEECVFRFQDADPSRRANAIAVGFSGCGPDPTRPIVVRQCAIGGRLSALGWTNMVAAPVLILRNFIQPGPNDPGILVQGQMRQVFVRNNVVMTEPLNAGIVIAARSEAVAPEILDIANNTVVGVGKNQFNVAAPASGVTIRENVLPSAFRFALGAEEKLDAVRDWQIAGNWYLIRPESDPDHKKLIFRRPDDPQVTPRFLSGDLKDADFARLAAMPDGRTAGALPPGPAPKEGDWFTRLRERWEKAAPR